MGGAVRCWGYGGFGALGYGNREAIGDDEAPASAGSVYLGAGRSATAVATGDVHSCALLDDRSVRCWGFAVDGRLGSVSPANVGDDETPGSVGPVDLGGPAKAISAGAGHTCAVLQDGSVRCWGYGNSGALGYANTSSIGDNETPASAGDVDLGATRTATAITTGFDLTCALLDTRPDVGNVRCWGSDGAITQYSYTGNGRLGLPTHSKGLGDDETPGSVPTIDLGASASAISAGDNHVCAILAGGSVRCWGLGMSGRLGYAGTDNVGDDETPASVGPVEVGGAVQAISAGGKHTCAILVGGSVRCWGSNRSGQLGYPNVDAVGDDETPASMGAVDLGAGRTAVAISAGQESTCARLDDGSVRCWGYGGLGRLGACNVSTIGDDETPGSVGTVNVEPGDGGVGCGVAITALSAAMPGAPATPAPAAPAPPPAAPGAVNPGTATDVLAAQERRMTSLRACLQGISRRAGSQRKRARRLSPRARSEQLRAIALSDARDRDRCRDRHGRTPGRVNTIEARAGGKDTIVLSFKAPGTDGFKSPAATSYLIKQSERPIRTRRDFRAAPALCKGSCSFAATKVGTRIFLVIGQLKVNRTYYYKVAARDNVSGRCGPRSKTVKATTREVAATPIPGHEGGEGQPAPLLRDPPTPDC